MSETNTTVDIKPPALDAHGNLTTLGGEKIPNHIGYLLPSIHVGDALPVGGSLFSGYKTEVRYLQTDQRADELADQVLATVMHSPEMQTDPNTSAAERLQSLLDTVSKTIWASDFSSATTRKQIRRVALSDQAVTPVGELLEAGAAECAEVALLCQLVLQKAGVKSYYVVGSVFDVEPAGSNRDVYPDEHAFLVVELGAGHILYDPYERVTRDGAASLFRIPATGVASLYDAMSSTGRCFLQAQPRFKQIPERYYGIGYTHPFPEDMLTIQ